MIVEEVDSPVRSRRSQEDVFEDVRKRCFTNENSALDSSPWYPVRFLTVTARFFEEVSCDQVGARVFRMFSLVLRVTPRRRTVSLSGERERYYVYVYIVYKNDRFLKRLVLETRCSPSRPGPFVRVSLRINSKKSSVVCVRVQLARARPRCLFAWGPADERGRSARG